MRRVHDFGMELRAVEAALGICDHGVRRAGRFRDHREARRHFGDVVAMAHPDLLLLALEQSVEERVSLHTLDIGPAKLAAGAAFDPAAQLVHHDLLAVADAKHRNAGRKDRRIGHRGTLPVHAGRPAREDDRLRSVSLQESGIDLVERVNFAIDAAFAQAPGDELRHLAAEVDDQGALVACLGHAAQ